MSVATFTEEGPANVCNHGVSVGDCVDAQCSGSTDNRSTCKHGIARVENETQTCWQCRQDASTMCVHGITEIEGEVACIYCLSPEVGRCGCGGSVGSVTRHQEGSAVVDKCAADSMFWCAMARHGFYTGDYCQQCHPKVELPMPIDWSSPIMGMAVGLTSPMGWECPKCKRIYGPAISGCSYCNDNLPEATHTTLDREVSDEQAK